MGECWGEGTATFMILGNTCTRSCGFCGVKQVALKQWTGTRKSSTLDKNNEYQACCYNEC
jgi:lipoate synthase